jgi:acetyl-CoA/propionyl-CoA carboxylase biotin carboxyl carrier protein
VQAQIRIAAGEPLPWSPDTLSQQGHAIECRVYAEDPARGFLPQAGPLLLYREPRRPGVRVDSGVEEGDIVSVHYDPLLAKVIAFADGRRAAIARARAALARFPVLGVQTNIAFLIAILKHAAFEAGDIDTTWLERQADRLTATSAGAPPIEAVAAAALAATATPSMPSGRPERTVPDPWDTLAGWQTGT